MPLFGKSRVSVNSLPPAGGGGGGAPSSSSDAGPPRAKRKKDFESALALLGKEDGSAADRVAPETLEEEERATAAAERATSSFIHGTRRGAPAEEQVQAATELARYVNQAYGSDARAFGAHLRRSRALAFVLQLLYEGELVLQRAGLMVLSNLVSDAFDARSSETKQQVLHASVFERIKDFVYSADSVAQTYAVACLQNLCKEVAFAKLLQGYELVEELERLVRVSPNEHLRKFAAGALFNTVEAIHRQHKAASFASEDAAALAAAGGQGTRRPRAPTLDPERETLAPHTASHPFTAHAPLAAAALPA